MSRAENEKRQAIIDACRWMNALGINHGTSGNISIRHEDGMLITSTSVPLRTVRGLRHAGIIRIRGHGARRAHGVSARASRHDRGRLVAGKSLWLAVEVETLARQYHGCLEIGQPPLLSSDEIERVRRKRAGYERADV